MPDRSLSVLTGALVTSGAGLLLLGLLTGVPLLLVLGAAILGCAWLERRGAHRTRRRMVTHMAWVAVALVAGTLAAGVGWIWLRAAPPTPDAFYDPPASVPATPGVLLRAEPYTQTVPAGARAWRILYTTTRHDGTPAVASALVLAPTTPTAAEPHPIVTWTHGTTGIVPGCAPSVLPPPYPFDANVPAVAAMLAQGWVMVAPDYAGMGTRGPSPYLVGQGEGRSALDAVRAARQMAEVRLAESTVVWGHSQGGHAALWTGILAPTYAPDLDVAGVAALAPASDLGPMLEAIKDTIVGRLMAAYVTDAYSEAYADVRLADYVGPSWRVRGMARQCLSGVGALLPVLVSATLERPVFRVAPTTGPFGARLRENTPDTPVTAPLLIAQGKDDVLVLPALQEAFVRRRCKGGQRLEYRTYDGRDHLSLVAAESPLTADLVDWTRRRFAGEPPPDGCPGVRP